VEIVVRANILYTYILFKCPMLKGRDAIVVMLSIIVILGIVGMSRDAQVTGFSVFSFMKMFSGEKKAEVASVPHATLVLPEDPIPAADAPIIEKTSSQCDVAFGVSAKGIHWIACPDGKNTGDSRLSCCDRDATCNQLTKEVNGIPASPVCCPTGTTAKTSGKGISPNQCFTTDEYCARTQGDGSTACDEYCCKPYETCQGTGLFFLENRCVQKQCDHGFKECDHFLWVFGGKVCYDEKNEECVTVAGVKKSVPKEAGCEFNFCKGTAQTPFEEDALCCKTPCEHSINGKPYCQ
jgi:hypothetical protein